MSQSWWGTGRQLGDGKALTELTGVFDGESVFAPAQPLTVRVRRICIREDRDGLLRGDNDLVVATTFQFGENPPVHRLHFLRNGVPLGCRGNFFDDFVLSVRDFPDKILTLRFQIYDVDGVSDDLINAVGEMAQDVAVAFPVIAPYAGAVGFGGPALLKLADSLDHHDRIIDTRLKLEMRDPGTGHNLLQPGYFVCFSKPIDAGLTLSGGLDVKNADGTEFKELSYGVLEVSRTAERFQEVEIDQKVATLLSELAGKGQSNEPPITYLRDTLAAYSNFRKLERATELRNKQDRTADEEKLLQELLQDEAIGPYLQAAEGVAAGGGG